MKQKPKLKKEYHDAVINEVQYLEEGSIGFEINLFGSGDLAFLIFHQVLNWQEVKAKFETARKINQQYGFIDQIIGIAKDSDRAFLMHLSAIGEVSLATNKVSET